MYLSITSQQSIPLDILETTSHHTIQPVDDITSDTG